MKQIVVSSNEIEPIYICKYSYMGAFILQRYFTDMVIIQIGE